MLRMPILTAARTLVADARSAFRRYSGATIASLALMSGAAMSQPASFSHPVQSVFANNASVSYGIVMNETADFMFSFILPQDYDRNNKVQVVLYFWTSGQSCTMRFGPSLVQRGRPGTAIFNKSPGMTPTDRSPNVVLPNNQIVQKVYTLDADPDFGQVMRRGDWLRVRFDRYGTNPSDTCNYAVEVLGIDVRYPVGEPGVR